jgi:Ca-activated chloride channel family protein
LWFLAFASLLIALTRPQWGNQVQVVEQAGVQVMVVLDVSTSMLAEDLKPNRLTRAKLEISDLMAKLNGNEIGLALFSGASFIQFPLTSDYDTARAFLDNAWPGVISRPGTAIGDAIDTAMGGFDPQRNSQKVIVIMTDGEDHEADPVAVAQQAAENGAIIYAIGFGSGQGEPIPEFEPGGQRTGYKRDENGEVVLSRLDEVTLQQIALATSGRYLRAAADGSELDELVSELEDLQSEQLESRFETLRIERFQWFLLVGFLALLVAQFIPDRKGTVRLKTPLAGLRSSGNVTTLALLLLTVFLTACSASAERLIAQGNRAFDEGAHEEALQAYQSAQELAPETAAPLYNIASTHYRQGMYPEALQFLQQALTNTGDELAQHSFYNSGNTFFQMEQWESAVEAYKEALRCDPGDMDAKYNLELALQQIVEQEQQQEEQEQESQEQQEESIAEQEQREQDQADQEQSDESQENQDQQDQSGRAQSDAEQSDQSGSEQNHQQVEGLTEEQARQLLETIGESTTTLQERLQQVFVAPGPPPSKDW